MATAALASLGVGLHGVTAKARFRSRRGGAAALPSTSGAKQAPSVAPSAAPGRPLGLPGPPRAVLGALLVLTDEHLLGAQLLHLIFALLGDFVLSELHEDHLV